MGDVRRRCYWTEGLVEMRDSRDKKFFDASYCCGRPPVLQDLGGIIIGVEVPWGSAGHFAAASQGREILGAPHEPLSRCSTFVFVSFIGMPWAC